MYVCMYNIVRMYAGMDQFMDGWMYACMYVCLYVCTYVRMYVCMHECIYNHNHNHQFIAPNIDKVTFRCTKNKDLLVAKGNPEGTRVPLVRATYIVCC